MTYLSSSDKDTIEVGIEAIQLYQEVLAQLPEESWLALSYSQPVIWRQIEEQTEFLKEILKSGSIPEIQI